MTKKPSAPAECANCGAAIPRHARACTECGADEQTGWRETDLYDGLDLPDEAFADTPPHRVTPRPGLRWYWLVTAGVILAALAGSALGLFR